MTRAELEEARQYGRKKLVCGLADEFVDMLYLGLLALLAARPLDSWLGSFDFLARHDSARLAALIAVVVFLHIVVSFPISWYGSHVLEHRFGLSNQSSAAWLNRYAKRNGLAVIFSVLLFLGLYGIIWTVGAWWWLVAAAALFGVSIVLGPLAPVLILPLFYKVEKLDTEEICQRLQKLTEGTGLSIEGVYRLVLSDETAKANAMLTGLGRTRRVLLGDTLLENLTVDEIEVVFAHEIGHHVHRHIPKMLLAGVVYSGIGFWICDRLLALAFGPLSIAELPVYTAPLVMFMLTFLSSVLEPVQNTISRHYERQSDRYALARTGKREAYRSAFQKLARINKEDPSPHPLEVFLLHSHPPIAERLALLGESQ